MKTAIKVIEKISTICGYLVAPLPLIAGFIICYEIVMRQFFDRPTLWVSETTAMLCGACYLLGGALNIKNDHHVRVDILYSRFSKRGRAILDCFNFLFLALYLLIMLKLIWPYMLQSIRLDEHSYTAWNPAVWPMKIILFAGFALVFLQALATFLRNIFMVIKGRSI
ncbi:MAG: TRAP transporter small permease subunit [Deltaproteobacteria bacterium]|nr:TRAP transporter small permease subunit [Deltaproteobacteria bacterium]